MTLEIVSHCWHYAPQLTYQLGSLVLFPPSNCQVTMTVWFSEEDTTTQSVLDFFSTKNVPAITWSFRSLPKEQLFRRAIGRNLAALQTRADWIWFADADMCFRNQCLDVLADLSPTATADLIYPRQIQISKTHEVGDDTLCKVAGRLCIADIDPADFVTHTYNRAIGGVQILRGRVAQKIGYCDRSPRFQKPIGRWSISTRDDVAFRQSVGTSGKAIDLPELYRIRHRRFGARDEFGSLQHEVAHETE